MKIKIELGSTESQEWGDGYEVELAPYSDIFAIENPGLPVGDMFVGQFSLNDHDIEIDDGTYVSVSINYHENENHALIAIKMDGIAFVQVHGVAFDANGNGLNLIFVAPKTSFPTSVTLVG